MGYLKFFYRWPFYRVALSGGINVCFGQNVCDANLLSWLCGQMCACAGSATPSLQLLYEASLCLWQLTFLQEAAEEISHSQEIISHLVEICRTAQKEKVF